MVCQASEPMECIPNSQAAQPAAARVCDHQSSRADVSIASCLQPVPFSQPVQHVTKHSMDISPFTLLSSPAHGSRSDEKPAMCSRCGSCCRPEPRTQTVTVASVHDNTGHGASGATVSTRDSCLSQNLALPAGPLRSPRLSSSSDSGDSNPCIRQRFEVETATAAARSPCSDRDEESSAFIQQYLYTKLPPVTTETDMDRLTRSMEAVVDNCIFYPDLDSVSAKSLLQDKDEGVFLVRNSSDPKFIFALSVKTVRGATSVRIQYQRGFFQLDCEDRMKRRLPRFESLMDLVDFHVAQCRDGTGDQCRWLETSGRKDMVVKLTKPLRHSPPSLLHMARLTVNQQLKDLHLPSCSTDKLPLPETMKTYLREYPFKI